MASGRRVLASCSGVTKARSILKEDSVWCVYDEGGGCEFYLVVDVYSPELNVVFLANHPIFECNLDFIMFVFRIEITRNEMVFVSPESIICFVLSCTSMCGMAVRLCDCTREDRIHLFVRDFLDHLVLFRVKMTSECCHMGRSTNGRRLSVNLAHFQQKFE